MDGSFCLVVAIGIVVFVVVVVLNYYQQQKRMEEMRALAQTKGYRYTQEGAAPEGALGDFALFSQGHARKASNVLSTEAEGAAATIMDYRYESGYGRNRHVAVQSVLHLESNRLDLPSFVLRPEGVFQKLGDLLGQQDIDFEGQPGFSAAYVLQGPSEAQIRSLFSSEKLAFFARRPGLCIEGQGRRLLYYRAKALVAPAAIPPFLQEGLAVLSLFAGKVTPPPAAEPDALAGLDEVLAELGVEDGAGAAEQ